MLQLAHELLGRCNPTLSEQQFLSQDPSEDQFWSVYGCVCVYGVGGGGNRAREDAIVRQCTCTVATYTHTYVFRAFHGMGCTTYKAVYTDNHISHPQRVLHTYRLT